MFGFPLIVFLMSYGIILSKMDLSKTIIMFVLLGIFELLIPLLVLIVLFKKNVITDMDVAKRSERVLPFLIITICFSVAVLLSRQFGNAFLFNYQLILFMTVLASFAITLFWKISLHTGITTVTIVFLTVFSGVYFLPVTGILPAIYWARFHLKRHTHSQLIAGVMVNVAITVLLLRFFGYVK